MSKKSNVPRSTICILFVTLCILFVTISYGDEKSDSSSKTSAAGEKPAQVKPYKPLADNQLMCLGAAPKGGRFKVKDISWPQKPGEAEICLWKDDKFAAFSITVDDNCKPDHQWWLQQAKKHGFKVTWFVITGGVDAKKNPGFSGTWADFKALSEAGMCIGSHTAGHNKDDSKRSEEEVRGEYGGSKASVEKNVGPCLVLAYPCGKGKADLAAEYFIASRGTVGYPNSANGVNYANTRGGHMNKGAINVILGLPVESPKWLAGKSKELKRGWYTPLYHYVQWGHNAEERAASIKKAEEMLDYVGRHMDKLWGGSFEEVAKYGQERDTATLRTVTAENNRIILSLTDKMKDDIFNFPLTIKVRLPEGWETVAAAQAEKPIDAKVVTHDGKPYALVQAVPDKGEISITPVTQKK